MQALFYCSGFTSNAAALVEADGPRPSLVATVAILHLPVAIGYGVRRAEGAFDVGAGHAWKDPLAYECIASRAACYAVSATIVLFAYNGELPGFFPDGLVCFPWFG